MKTNLKKLLMLCGFILLVLSACKKDQVKTVASTGKPGDLTASSSTVLLDKTKLNDTTAAVTFTFSPANYGYKAAVTYTLQIDSAGDNWAKPSTVTLKTGSLNQSYTTAAFNSLLLKMNLPASKASQVNVRLVQSISSAVTPVYSNVLSLTVTPFNLTSYIYVPGAYQGWSPPTADSLVSLTGNGVYTGYVFFSQGNQFKITPAKNWNSSYGDAGNGTISLASGGNLTSPTSGLYLLTVDLNKNTIVYTNYDHIWSVIGSAAQGWSTDVNTTFNQSANAYQVTVPLSASGQFKFRADNDWTLSLGDVSPVTGQLTSANGANINVPADGTYLVSLSFGNPLVYPTYTLVKQ